MNKKEIFIIAAKSFGSSIFTKEQLFDLLCSSYNWLNISSKKLFDDYCSKAVFGEKSSENWAFMLKIDNNLYINWKYYLFKKIQEEHGIRTLCYDLTGCDSNPEYVEILLSNRKKDYTEWYRKVFDFLHSIICDEDIKKEIDNLKESIDNAKKEQNIKTYTSYLNKSLVKVLNLLIGSFYKIDLSLCDKLLLLKEECIEKNPPLLKVLCGEYCDNLLCNITKDKFTQSKIILYFNNIKDIANEKTYDIKNYLCSVLAHEYFHFHHFFNIYEESINNHTIPNIKTIFSYEPGSLVLEGLASRFEYAYCVKQKYGDKIDSHLEDSWYTNDYNYYPYSIAKYIASPALFGDIFGASLNDLNKAFKIIKDEIAKDCD